MNWEITDFTDKYIRKTHLLKFCFYLTLLYTTSVNATNLEAGKAAYLDQNYESAGIFVGYKLLIKSINRIIFAFYDIT